MLYNVQKWVVTTPTNFLKVKSVIKYALFKEISVNIIFYYNKSHISLAYNLIVNSFDICTVKLYNGYLHYHQNLSYECQNKREKGD
jgi:hypothetical protein